MMMLIGWMLLIAGCSQRAVSLSEVRVIAFQPVGSYDRQELDTLRLEIGRFFHKQTVVLPALPMPVSFQNMTKGERYSADSLIKFLAARTSDTLPIVLGFTDKDIFTTVRNNDGTVKAPASSYAVWGIFGLGYCPGHSAIVSSTRLRCTDELRYRRRLKTVALHELGHNFGLPHCPNPHCIMNDANEKISTVDNAADDYCSSCRKKLGL